MFLEKLSGQRTYIIAFLVGIVGFLQYLGKLDTETVSTLLILLNGGGLAALRAGVNGNK